MVGLRKISVTNGVYWVEAPGAGLSVLCGCPADAVKHLMKRGLIVSTEVSQVACETGPNAILLSDVLIQNGQFSNLAEFPVLQMLYRQGMLLPGHPNNTGVKPLLIGARKQLEAQLAYIFRGNYGLASADEMIAAGADPATAERMMQIKLKFAFGRIRPTGEMLDVLVLDRAPVVLPGGVQLRRISTNIFEFRAGADSVTVNLNLSENEDYPAPYPLGFHDIKREHFAVIHAGEGDGWDVNRPCISSVLMYQGNIFLIDAGPNILASLTSLGIGINEVRGVFHTHAHDDHFAGIPTLIRAGHRIRYFTTPLVRASVSKKLSALLSMDEGRLRDFFDIADLEMGKWNDIEGLEVKPIMSPHPVETNVFIFRTLFADGYRTYAHLADIAAAAVLEDMVEPETDRSTVPGLGQPPPRQGLTRQWVEAIKQEYLTPVNLKKIDIGGGMIHGMAQDFRNDLSDKIVLAHIGRGLTPEEKRIGSGAAFGTSEVLIPDQSDNARRFAFNFLTRYFPTAHRYTVRNLLNNELVRFKPEEIVLREGLVNQDVFLILTGTVEVIDGQAGRVLTVSAGAMIGEYSGLSRAPLAATYRAASFVQAFRFPNTMFLDFVRRNDLHEQIARIHETREFLRSTWLFGESLSYATHNKLVEAVATRRFAAAGVPVDPVDPTRLHIVRAGSVERRIDGRTVEVLGSGDFFGGEPIIGEAIAPASFVTREPTLVFLIPAETVREIPIALWKLVEWHEKFPH